MVKKVARPTWDEYFLSIAKAVSTRSTCPRAQVGAVIVKNHRILSTGYNGSPSGQLHCTEAGCTIEMRGIMVKGKLTGEPHCMRAIHAETNAVAQAARYGIAVEGSTVYFYDSLGRTNTCSKCEQVMTSAGIKEVKSVI
jgi:dCMP deaminase